MKKIPPYKHSMLAAFVAAALVCMPAFAAKKSKVVEDDGMPGLMEMSDQLDNIDKQDFQAAIASANECTRARNFSCSESELAKAAKAANGGQDKKLLAAARQNIANEKARIAEEERRLVEAEERRREEERQARLRRERESEDGEPTYSASNDIGTYIMQKGQENAAILSDLNHQTSAAYAETNRRLAEQAAERTRAREEREEERRREEQREREASIARADTEHQRDEARAREQEQSRQREEEKAARQAAEQERVRDQERARQQQAAEKRTAEQVKQQTETDYLAALTRGIRLRATKCPGDSRYFATGKMPSIKREMNCIDVHFRAACPGSAAYSSGVLGTFGTFGGCAGDLAEIEPKPGCLIEQVRVEVTSVTGCTSGKW